MEGLGSVTYHDPCYLGRGNGETEAPRAVIDAMSDARVEMPRNGTESFCCGAGGGGLWLDVPGEDRVENIRSCEAAETGAKTVVTGCPFCKPMLEAGNQSLPDGKSTVIKDLAELVAERMPRSDGASR
jgi:Fe-S oxidoreductase